MKEKKTCKNCFNMKCVVTKSRFDIESEGFSDFIKNQVPFDWEYMVGSTFDCIHHSEWKDAKNAQ